MGKSVPRLLMIWVDGGFSGESFMMWVMDRYRWLVVVPEQSRGFVLFKKRSVVGRTFGWLMGCQQSVRDYERLPETSEVLIYLAMIRMMVGRLA